MAGKVDLPGLGWAVEAGKALTVAIWNGAPAEAMALIARHGLDGPLQQIGEAVLLAGGGEHAAAVADALRERGWLGDEVLAEDIEALSGGPSPLRRAVPVDLDELSQHLSGGLDETAYLDLQTGQILNPDFDDIDIDDFDEAIPIGRPSQDPWRDLDVFAHAVVDPGSRERLLRAIQGRGAFRRFKDEIGRLDLLDEWFAFHGEREAGRTRDWLAEHGLRSVPRRP